MTQHEPQPQSPGQLADAVPGTGVFELAVLRCIVEDSPDIIWVKDRAGRYLLANAAFAAFTGFPADTVIGQTDADLYPPGEAEAFQGADQMVFESGESFESEYIVGSGGQKRVHRVRKSPCRDQAGRVVAVVGVARDVTFLKQAERGRQESEEHYRRMVETSPDGIWIHRHGRTLFVNAALVQILGASDSAEIMGRSVYDFVLPDDLVDVRERIEGAQRRRASVPPGLRTLVRLDGTLVHTEVAVEPTTWEGQSAVQAVVRDVSDRLRAQEALRASEERYALAATAANDGLWDWDLRGEVLYYSPRWKEMLGLDEHDVGSMIEEWFARVHAEDIDRLRGEIEDHIAGKTDHLESLYRVRHRDGAWRWVLARGLAVRDTDGKAYRLAGSQTDVTERKLAEEQLLYDALHDSLTGLPNRALFMEELQLAIDRRRRRPAYGFTVLFLDLDRFKIINDSLGHMAGDTLLIEVAHRILKCLRPGDRVARLGGDEFTVLLDDVDDVTGATHVADRIHHEMQAPFLLSGREVFSGASIGIALSRSGYHEPAAVLRDADLAMYRAKRRGGGRYEVFDLRMHQGAIARLELETDLRRALDRQEFALVYQPIMADDGQRIAGFEALARWNHPRRGLVQPDTFIPVAEETNLTFALGRWVLHEACRQLRAWQTNLHGMRLGVGVNVSGRQLLAPNLTDEVAAALEETGIEPRFVHLEITENVLMQDVDAAADVLAALKALGVRLHMDDFGTGYSSLSYLRRFPLDGLKIDRLFVSRMDEPQNLELVRTIVALAHNLGLQVVAEGVETPLQRRQLREMSCELMQGYLFSPPLDPAAADGLLQAYRAPA